MGVLYSYELNKTPNHKKKRRNYRAKYGNMQLLIMPIRNWYVTKG